MFSLLFQEGSAEAERVRFLHLRATVAQAGCSASQLFLNLKIVAFLLPAKLIKYKVNIKINFIIA